jgi:hypothetical protein
MNNVAASLSKSTANHNECYICKANRSGVHVTMHSGYIHYIFICNCCVNRLYTLINARFEGLEVESEKPNDDN